MLQISLDHFLRHLPHRCTEIPSCPKMLSPVSFLYVGKFPEQLARRPPFEPPHDLTRHQGRWTAHHDMHVILTYHSLDVMLRISNALQVSLTKPRVLSPTASVNTFHRYFVPIRNGFDLKDGMTPISIIYPDPQLRFSYYGS